MAIVDWRGFRHDKDWIHFNSLHFKESSIALFGSEDEKKKKEGKIEKKEMIGTSYTHV